MNLLTSIAAMQAFRSRHTGQSLGFVPTMGALHAGHLSLVQKSLQDNAKTVVSIFINPTQFDKKWDLEHYPQEQARDQALLSELGVDAVFLPDYQALYPDDFRYRVSESSLSQLLCGKHRPGHFEGVLSVVMKLFNIVKPDNAYFGEKDYQQLQLIRGMCEAFFLQVNIVPCPVVREPDGLAMSSRNARLNAEQRTKAAGLHQVLNRSDRPETARTQLEQLGFSVDYVEDFQGRRLAAVSLGEIRLIDNVPLKQRLDYAS